MPARDARSMPRWALPAVLAAAAAIRLWLLTTPALELDADEATTGIVARRILEGRHRAFFAGSDYMGSMEQYVQAAVLAVAPDTALTLRLPQAALAVVACFLVHRLARRCGLSEARSLLAAALFAVGPYFPVYWGTKVRGAYSAAMVICLASLVVVLSVDRDDRRLVAKVGLFGLLAGAGFWANQQTAYVLVPAALWVAASTRGRWPSSAAAMAAGFVVGASPALWHAATTEDSVWGANDGNASIADRARHFLIETIPDFLGVRDDGEPLVGWLPPAFAVLVALLVLGAATDRHRRGLAAILTLRTDRRSGIGLLLLVLLLSPLLYVASGAAVSSTTRFVFLLYAVVPVLAAAVPIPGWLQGRARAVELGGLAVVLFAAHTWHGAQHLIAEDDGGHPVWTGQVVYGEDMAPVADALGRAGATTAYADYWLAHPLNWEADGDVLVEAIYSPRFPHITEAVAADPSPALVVADAEIDAVRAALDGRGSTYDATPAAGWWVVTAIEPGLHLPYAATIAEAVAAA